MASTLGILDVLSRLREESERASTALAAQEVGFCVKYVFNSLSAPWDKNVPGIPVCLGHHSVVNRYSVLRVARGTLTCHCDRALLLASVLTAMMAVPPSYFTVQW